MLQANQAEITVAGHICLDISPDFSKIKRDHLNDILTPGKLINVGNAQMSVGGVVSNTGVSLSVLGIKTALAAKLGDDVIGGIILSELQKTKADVKISTISGESSSYTVVLNIPGFDRIFLHNPGANDTYTADDVDFSLVAQSKLFHFGYPTLMSVVFLILSVTLTIIHVKYSFLIALGIAFVDALPILGSGTVLIPWSLGSLIGGNYRMAISLIVIYLIIILTRQLLEPKVLSTQIGLHPLATLLAMYVGLNLVGVLGMILGPVLVLITVNFIRTYRSQTSIQNPRPEGTSGESEAKK